MNGNISTQEYRKVNDRLVLENIRRVLFTSFISLFILPLLMVVNKFFNESGLAGMYNEVLLVFEGFCAMSTITAYSFMCKRDIMLGRFMYRTFWLMFEIFSLAVVYADSIADGKFTFYAVMLATLTLAPLMSVGEQIYYIVLQLVFAVFAIVKFHASPNDALNILLVNGLFITTSRVLYSRFVDRLLVREHSKSMREASLTDELTGLLSSTGFDKSVSEDAVEAVEGHSRMTLLLVGIDEFDEYRFTYGDDKCDECVVAVADTIRQVALRSTGAACRLSGGRFMVYVDGGSESDPVRIAEKLRKAVADRHMAQSRRAANPYVTVSIGVASRIPKDAEEFAELVEEAEDALAGAAEQGCNLTMYGHSVFGTMERRAN